MSISINGSTKIIGIIGNPLEHSVSPMLHNEISSMLGKNLVYVPFCVEKERLEDAVLGLKSLGVVGFNVTAPYKKDIMKYVDYKTKSSLLMGAVNTVKNVNGRLYGYNTDAEGFVRAFRMNTNRDFKGLVVTIFGAGGAARAIAVKLAHTHVKKINIVNRTKEHADIIRDTINENISSIVETYTNNDKIEDICQGSDVLINATSVGMLPDTGKCVIKLKNIFNKNQFVYDIIYNPKQTKFLSMAQSCGCSVMNGLGMLFYQAIASYEIWVGYKFNEGELARLYGLLENIY
ncbi:MAG: shikimate dehydrogenase [Clostridiales bacterium]|nr:shikimate dehydrogenase [Clostridiales bacterium]